MNLKTLISISLNKSQRDLFNSAILELSEDEIPKGLLAQFRRDGKQIFVDAIVLSDKKFHDIRKVLHDEI